MNGICPKCGEPCDKPQHRYCRKCKNAYDRAWRAKQARELKYLRRITRTLSRETLEENKEIGQGKG